MKRKIYTELLNWKSKEGRMPLILQGARQVGKSYILQKFGESEFPGYHIFNFEQDKKLATIFEEELFPEKIITELAIRSGRKIVKESDLVIFDEIQECPGAITGLKYFSENMPELALCGAGSLIGVMMSSESFPVGKVEFLNLYPLNFEEFLTAFEDEISIEIFNNLKNGQEQSEVAHARLWGRLKEYFVTGGMPRAVSEYISLKDDMFEAMSKVRTIQKQLLESYNRDFAKHSGKINSMQIVAVFEDIPMQLSKNYDDSVKRYRFKGVIPGKKSYIELQGPIDWLVRAGLIIKIKICNRAELPFESFCKNNIFKLYLFDIGLLGCMLDIPFETLISEDYGIAKGYFAENFTAQEFLSSGVTKLYSWSERNSEIEFIRNIRGNAVPIEVKSSKRTRAKSLDQYIIKYSPPLAVKLSANRLRFSKDSKIMDCPLYMAGPLGSLLEQLTLART